MISSPQYSTAALAATVPLAPSATWVRARVGVMVLVLVMVLVIAVVVMAMLVVVLVLVPVMLDVVLVRSGPLAALHRLPP